MERWCTECPHCGEYHNIVFADIRFEYEEKIVSGEKTFTVTEVYYICPGCGCISSEREMKKQPAKWIAKSPAAYKNGVRSFWLNSFVSPWVTWESTIVKYLEAKDNSRELQAVYNTRFGELWEDRGNLMGESDLLARREDYEAELPDGVLVLTCGVDTQDDRLEYEVVGFGHFGESWGIKKGIIMGRPDEDDVWADLDDVISHVYRFASGVGLRISLTFVDEGGHFTQDVRLRCSARLRRNMFAIAGSNRHDDPYTAPPKKQKIVIDGKVVGMCWQYRIGVDAGKQIITDNLRVQTPGSRYSHFPRRDDYGPAYFTGLLSERLEYNTKKKQPWEWVKLPGHERNEALDCRNYALAAVRALAPDFDAADRRLKAARTGQSPAATAASKPAAKKTRKPKPSEPNTKKYYDDW
jgi:phage terminase large subunit GpA-like protein